MISRKEKALYPWADERQYAKTLNDMILQLQVNIKHFIANDNESSEFEQRFEQFFKNQSGYYGDRFAHDVVKTMINGVNRVASAQVQKAIERHDQKNLVRDALGDLSDDEKAFMNAKLVENISLIKSIGDEYLNKVQDAVYRAKTTGMSTKDLVTQIQAAASEGGITTVSQRRANLIARDQTGSINGQLTKFKQQEAGINNFRWETAEDERVRPAHREIDGKIFSWVDGWAGVYPGDPIQCRCVATSVFDDEAADASDDEFWDPEAPDAVFPKASNGSPKPPKVEPRGAEKPDTPYWSNLPNKPDWLKATGAKINTPVERVGTQISTGEVERIENTPSKAYNRGRSNRNEISVLIDKFKPCLEDRKTGEILETSYRSIKIDKRMANELRKQGWNFDWSKYQNQKIISLTLSGSKEIQGLITYHDEPESSFTFVDLVESAPHNIGHNGKYFGVGGHLFAIAVEHSFKVGFEGYISFKPKTNLVQHYEEILGAKLLHSGNQYLDTVASLRLLKTYTLNNENGGNDK